MECGRWKVGLKLTCIGLSCLSEYLSQPMWTSTMFYSKNVLEYCFINKAITKNILCYVTSSIRFPTLIDICCLIGSLIHLQWILPGLADRISSTGTRKALRQVDNECAHKTHHLKSATSLTSEKIASCKSVHPARYKYL